MATSAVSHEIKFRNRAEDQFNDNTLNPVKVTHYDLTDKMQTARELLHEKLVDRFDTNVPRDVKQFWFISSICDPRFKQLKFKHDHMLDDRTRARAIKWFTDEFNKNYRDKFSANSAAAAGTTAADSAAAPVRRVKRRKTSAASFFADSDDEGSEHEEGDDSSQKDELTEYLALPQIKFTTKMDPISWWKENEKTFPNVAVMARQYLGLRLGCPASSAAVERLFSQVGIAFSDQRKSASPKTLASIMFSNANLP
mmetsp:Transcript_50727/g.114025  ORF Transcript_50727/g.114025 Transcript_50727/m.114025 type:complete len:254 (-) Transcript_50727:141-902(-)